MDKAGWEDNRRFDGGLFSGTGTNGNNIAGNRGTAENGRPDGNGQFSGNRQFEENRRFSGNEQYNGMRATVPNYAVQNYPVQNYPMPGYSMPNYGRCPYCGQDCRGNHNKSPERTALVIVAVASVAALVIALFAVLFCLGIIIALKDDDFQMEKSTYGYSYEKPYISPDEVPYQGKAPELPGNQGEVPGSAVPFEEWTEKAPKTGAVEEGEYYGDIRDAVRTDLKYSIEWKNYEFEGNSDTVMIAVDYPVIEGDIPNLEIVNQTLADETKYFEEYYAEYAKYMMPEEVFGVYAEGFVTYMDEERMSVVFRETIYTDYWTDCGLFCVNIDMENGVVLDNGSILAIDDEFAVDFRMRCKAQNGDISTLNYLTDQELVQYLTNAGTSIVFYTPLGMEVGVNYGENYATATYKDYEQFLQRY